MQYFIAFLEGIITFISPCLLPMLPIYISYFAGGSSANTKKAVVNAASFVTGFTLVFMAMGALAGTLGGFINQHINIVNIICGAVVVAFGLSFMGIINLNIFKGSSKAVNTKEMGVVSSFIFGIVFSIGWTPCVGAFLGSALMLASQQGHAVEGMLMLLSYSIGLGIPFILSAVLIEKLKTAFDFIKQHYDIINKVCGIILVAIGVLMATGLLGRLLAVLS